MEFLPSSLLYVHICACAREQRAEGEIDLEAKKAVGNGVVEYERQS